MTVEIEVTQEHIDLVDQLAERLYHTNGIARLAGLDELQSEAYVILWMLVSEYGTKREEDVLGDISFELYLRMRVPQRLIDWLRTQYGRWRKAPEGSQDEKWTNGRWREGPSAKMVMAFMTDSLTDHEDGLRPDEWLHYQVPDTSPSVEDQVESRDEWRRFLEVLQTFTPVYQYCLLWPILGTDRTDIVRLGASANSASTLRFQAKARAYERLGRPFQKRVYVRHE